MFAEQSAYKKPHLTLFRINLKRCQLFLKRSWQRTPPLSAVEYWLNRFEEAQGAQADPMTSAFTVSITPNSKLQKPI